MGGRQNAGAGSLYGQQEGEGPERSGVRGHPVYDLLPHQACLLHLPEDVRSEVGYERHLRPGDGAV